MRQIVQIFLIASLLLSFAIAVKSGRIDSRNVSRIRRQSVLNRSCVYGQWECDNHQMIKCQTVCDGKADCNDKSDETPLSCRNKYCGSYEFRCAYGACIPTAKECDGHQDCADNSDELSIECPGVLGNWTKIGDCLDGYFKCQSGECIHHDQLCDGTEHCRSGDDETEAQCSNHYCPEPNFQCEYGACILETLKCDSNIDCADGSDESINICGRKKYYDRPIYISPQTGTTINNEIDEAKIDETKDLQQLMLHLQIELLENQLEILKFMYKYGAKGLPTFVSNSKFLGVLEPIVTAASNKPQVMGSMDPLNEKSGLRKSENEDCEFNPTPNLQLRGSKSVTYVPNGNRAEFICNGQNGLIGVNSTYCINGKFTDDLPKCQAFCSTVQINTLSIKATCHTPEGLNIPCTGIVPPKTIAILDCKVGYKKPDRSVKDAITCQEDGTWDYHVHKCEQICGTITEGRGFVIGGHETNISRIPWHAAIYQQRNKEFIQICGGTIINSNAIVTAAHCFWDGLRQKMNEPYNYRVVVGKTLRDYNTEEVSVQKFLVLEIDYYNQFQDINGLFVSDIAVLVLNSPIIFHSYVKPICIEYNLKNNERYVPSGLIGRVAGWGLTSSGGEPSPVLKIINLPTVDYNTCYRDSPPEFRPFITSDKFCAGFTTGHSVCVGDSGGGLVFESKFKDNSSAFYLRGIVSTGPRLEGSCDNNKYSAFTDVHLNIVFLYKYIIGS